MQGPFRCWMKPSQAAGASAISTMNWRTCTVPWTIPSEPDEMDRILARFGDVQEEYEHLGGYALEAQAREVLHGLGFKDDQIDGDVGALSGGWKMRVALARVLLGMAGCAADGRTDQSSRHRIDHLAGAVPQVISRRAADDLARPRVHEPHRLEDRGDRWRARSSRTRAITTSTSASAPSARRNQQAAFARQQSMLAKEQRFIDRFKTHAAKAAQVQSRIKALDKIEKIELPKKRQVVKFDFRVPPRSGDQVAVIERSAQELRLACDLRRVQSDHPPRRTLGRNGQKRRGQDHAAQDDCRRQRARCGKRAAGRQPATWDTSRSSRSTCSIRI